MLQRDNFEKEPLQQPTHPDVWKAKKEQVRGPELEIDQLRAQSKERQKVKAVPAELQEYLWVGLVSGSQIFSP